MKSQRIYTVVICSLLTICSFAQSIPIYKDATQPIEVRVHDLLSRMTVEEKVAQLRHIHEGSVLNEDNTLNLEKLKNIKNDIKVILPSHHDCPIDPSYIEKDLEDILALKEGRLRHEKTPNMPCDTYHGTYVDYYYIVSCRAVGKVDAHCVVS